MKWRCIMSTTNWRNWRDYVKPLPVQDKFALACHFGSQDGNFSSAREYLLKHANLDIPSVVNCAVYSDDPEFLKELFAYYHKNVVDKLQTIKEKQAAMKQLKSAVEEEIFKNGWDKLPEDNKEIIEKEFPRDERKIEDFEEPEEKTPEKSDEEVLDASSDENSEIHPIASYDEWMELLGSNKGTSNASDTLSDADST